MKAKNKLYKINTYILLIIISFLFLFPVLWLFLTSLKEPINVSKGFEAFESGIKWDNYQSAWNTSKFDISFYNTLIVGFGTVIISILVGTPMAYSLARYSLRGKQFLSGFLIFVRMLPEILFLLPLYSIYRTTGLFDTKIGLILAFQILTLPYTVWLQRSFILNVPNDLEEAARIDGCSDFQVLRKITLPLIAPGVVATSILSFIAVWTSLLFPLTLAYSNAQTVSISIANFKGYGSFNWPVMAAACVIATVPQIILFSFINKYLVSGLTMGAVKG